MPWTSGFASVPPSRIDEVDVVPRFLYQALKQLPSPVAHVVNDER